MSASWAIWATGSDFDGTKPSSPTLWKCRGLERHVDMPRLTFAEQFENGQRRLVAAVDGLGLDGLSCPACGGAVVVEREAHRHGRPHFVHLEAHGGCSFQPEFTGVLRAHPQRR